MAFARRRSVGGPALRGAWWQGARRRGFCPSCGARRMVESAALPVDRVLPLPAAVTALARAPAATQPPRAARF